MTPYLKALLYTARGMVLSWRNVPVYLRDCSAPLRDLARALLMVLLGLALPFLVPLAPVAAWLVLRDQRQRTAREQARIRDLLARGQSHDE